MPLSKSGLNILVMPVILLIGGCALGWNDQPDAHTKARFQGTRVKLETTPDLCSYIQADPANAGAAIDEASQREGWVMAGAKNEDGRMMPVLGSSDASVFCLWGKPDEISKDLSADGIMQETWSYTDIGGATIFTFAGNKLASIGRVDSASLMPLFK